MAVKTDTVLRTASTLMAPKSKPEKPAKATMTLPHEPAPRSQKGNYWSGSRRQARLLALIVLAAVLRQQAISLVRQLFHVTTREDVVVGFHHVHWPTDLHCIASDVIGAS